MPKSQPKVLVTGADGFIGSHLTEELVQSGYEVRAFVFYNSFNSWGWLEDASPEIRAKLEVVSGDIRDPYFVREAVSGCEQVFHLAALIGIPYSYHAPSSYIDTNIKGTLHVLQAARDKGVSRVVHTSTSEVYGTAQFVPIHEGHPLQGQSPYAASKIAADQLALSFYHSFETPVTIVRPFNTYGPRQSARAIIPAIITQLAEGRKRIKLGSLHPTRDLSYVKDTVQGFIAIAESKNSLGEVINLGSNFEISMGELAELIAEQMNIEIEIECDQQRVRPPKSEVGRLWSDNAKALRLANWKPQWSGKEGLREGLSQTIRWFTKGDHLAQYKAELCNL